MSFWEIDILSKTIRKYIIGKCLLIFQSKIIFQLDALYKFASLDKAISKTTAQAAAFAHTRIIT